MDPMLKQATGQVIVTPQYETMEFNSRTTRRDCLKVDQRNMRSWRKMNKALRAASCSPSVIVAHEPDVCYVQKWQQQQRWSVQVSAKLQAEAVQRLAHWGKRLYVDYEPHQAIKHALLLRETPAELPDYPSYPSLDLNEYEHLADPITDLSTLHARRAMSTSSSNAYPPRRKSLSPLPSAPCSVSNAGYVPPRDPSNSKPKIEE